MITTVAPAHLEAFARIEGIAREKAAIFDGLEPGGVAVLPADLPVSARSCWPRPARPQARHGHLRRRAAADWLTSGAGRRCGTVVRAARHGQACAVQGAVPRPPFCLNGLAVLAVAEALGLDPAIAAADLGRWQPPAGRGTRERIVLDPVEETGLT
jgi:UDP-N-acetylmuramoyl-tripeptide--D-alanyl-D-alanine ligase